MADPSTYQFQLDWDFPAAGFARTYSYRGSSHAFAGVCSKAGFRSRLFWFVLGAGATYWWMRAAHRRRTIQSEPARRVADRKAPKEEWVVRLSREVVHDDDEDNGDDVDVEDDAEYRSRSRARSRKVALSAELADTVTDALEVALDSISLAVSNLKEKIAQRRGLSGDFSLAG